MIRRSEQYNSDYMSRAMDERLEQLEERLTALYANAALETQSDFYDFMEKYKKDYLAMLDKLDAEKITKAEFDLWCSKKILKTTQYKEMLATLTNILVNTDVAAMAIIRGKLPFVVAQSYNFAQSLGFAAADKAGLSVGTFQVYNDWSVQKIIKDNPRLLPKVDIPLDKQWNKDKINTAITHSIIHGDSIPKVAKRLREVTNMDKNSAIRNARTSMTGAENLGRNESIKFMKKNGVPVQLMWSATHDSRTRDTHLLLDRTFQNEKGYFGEGILSVLLRFPGDPLGQPQEIYNCRCRASIYLEGIDHSKDAELYDKFMTENYPDDYRQLKKWEEKTGRAEERRQTLEYQKVLKEIHKTGYYDPKELAKSVEPIVKEPDNNNLKPDVKRAETKVKNMEFNDRDEVVETIKDLTGDESVTWCKAINETEYKVLNIEEESVTGGSYYDPANKKITLTADSSTNTFFHETAHAYDETSITVETTITGKRKIIGSDEWRENKPYVASFNGATAGIEAIYNLKENAWEEDSKTLAKWLGVKRIENNESTLKAILKGVHAFEKEYGHDASTVLSDMIDAHTVGEFPLFIVGGHSKQYWEHDYKNRFSEGFAEISSLKAQGNTKAVEELRKIMPNITDSVEKVYNIAFMKGEDYVRETVTDRGYSVSTEVLRVKRKSDI